MTTINSVQDKILHDTSVAKRLLFATGVLTAATFCMGLEAAPQKDAKKTFEFMGAGIATALAAVGTRRAATRVVAGIEADPSNPRQEEMINKLQLDQASRVSRNSLSLKVPYLAGSSGLMFGIGARHPGQNFVEFVGVVAAVTTLAASADHVSDHVRLILIRDLSRPQPSALRPE